VIDDNTLDYIRSHRTEDVRTLALKKNESEGINMITALTQIQGWQTARQKLPILSETEGIIFPPHLSMQQCSSEQTAEYKRELIRKIFADESANSGSKGELLAENPNGQEPENLGDLQLVNLDEESYKIHGRFIDLTGGFGIDFSFIAPLFEESIVVERQPLLCDILKHNLPLLGLPHAEVVCGDGMDYLSEEKRHFTAIFIDPARRDEKGRKMVAIADCEPDVASNLEMLLEKSDKVIIKLSPMLDITKAITDLRHHVSQVHIISVKNECKELLLVIGQDKCPTPHVFCVNDEEVFEYQIGETEEKPDMTDEIGENNKENHQSIGNIESAEKIQEDEKEEGAERRKDGNWLYEPNASIMKAGCFDAVAKTTGVDEIAKNSHLFVSKTPIPSFPGKGFEIVGVSTMNSKQLRQALQGIERADITTRNFPLKPEELRKKLKLKEGGPHHLFATTNSKGQRIIIICKTLPAGPGLS